MGNKLHREEIVFLNQNKTTRIWRPNGTELYMHKDEVFEKGRLKQGHYVAEEHNPVTGETFHWTLSTGEDKQSKTPPTTGAPGPPKDHTPKPSPGPDRDASEPGGCTAGGSETELKALPGIESIKPITHQPLPHTARAASDSEPTGSQAFAERDSEAGHDSATFESWTKLPADEDCSEASASWDNRNAQTGSGTHKRKPEVDPVKPESGPSKFSLTKLQAIFSSGGRQAPVDAQRAEPQTPDNTSSQCSAGDKVSITDTVCLEFFKGIANSV